MIRMATIPHPPYRVPLLGDIIGIDRVNPNTATLAMMERLGPIYRRSIMGTDLTFVGSASLAEQAFDEASWKRYEGRPIQQLESLVGDGLFTAVTESDSWQKSHEALMPAFSKDAMSRYFGVMLETAQSLVESLKAAPGNREAQPLFARVAHEVIGRAGFSYSFGPDMLDNSHAFPAAMARALQHVQKAAIPLVGKRPGEKAQYERDRDLLLGTVREVVEGRSAGSASGNDLLDTMLEAGLPQQLIENQLLTFLIAGQETTASTLAFLAYELGRRPELVARMREEVAATTDEGPITFENAPRMRLVRAAISESLRLYPSAPGIFRVAKEATALGDYQFSPGEWVFVLLLAVHRDPEVWGASAAEFAPDRFMPGGASYPAAAYKPFGTGIRSCIGRQFAQLEITVVIAEMVRGLDWSVVEPEGALEFDETLTIRPRGLWLDFAPRA